MPCLRISDYSAIPSGSLPRRPLSRLDVRLLGLGSDCSDGPSSSRKIQKLNGGATVHPVSRHCQTRLELPRIFSMDSAVLLTGGIYRDIQPSFTSFAFRNATSGVHWVQHDRKAASRSQLSFALLDKDGTTPSTAPLSATPHQLRIPILPLFDVGRAHWALTTLLSPKVHISDHRPSSTFHSTTSELLVGLAWSNLSCCR